MKIFYYIVFCLYFCGVINYPLMGMDDGETGTHSDSDKVEEYIRRCAEEVPPQRSITLEPRGSSIVLSDGASFNERAVIGAHRERGFKWFGIYNKRRILEWEDHAFHYLTGVIFKTFYETNNFSHTNYVMLALDATAILKDEEGHCYLRRYTKPLLFDYKTKSFTINETETTAFGVFLSYGDRSKTNHKKIVESSLEGPLEVEDIRKNKYRLHFYSEIIHRKGDGTETAAFTFMKQHFPQISEEPNFDSEVHAIHALLTNPQVIDEFFKDLGPLETFISFGLRYYSFLDTCSKCQKFLEYNQPVLKDLFMKSIRVSFPSLSALPDIPFLAITHNNRIFGGLSYSLDLEKRKEYPYAEAGPNWGCFVSGTLPQYEGEIVLTVGLPITRLMRIIHEPDLGEDDELGIVRQYFTHLTEIKIRDRGYKDEHARVLAVKLRRMNPLTLRKVDLSDNAFGVVFSDFLDDPITLTTNEEIAEIIESLQKCPNLEVVNLSGARLSSLECLRALKRSIQHWQALRVIQLRAIHFERQDFSYIARKLGLISNLRVLNLNNNFIGYEGAGLLTELLSNNWLLLEELHLSLNALCHKDGRERADDPYIESLKYDPKAFLDLAEVIASHPALRTLDISHYDEQIRLDDLRKFMGIIKDKKSTMSIVEKRYKRK